MIQLFIEIRFFTKNVQGLFHFKLVKRFCRIQNVETAVFWETTTRFRTLQMLVYAEILIPKLMLKVLKYLGHSIEYNISSEVETAQAENSTSYGKQNWSVELFLGRQLYMNIDTQTGHRAPMKWHFLQIWSESETSKKFSIFLVVLFISIY